MRILLLSSCIVCLCGARGQVDKADGAPSTLYPLCARPVCKILMIA
jgi:hypothetical protein